jgi:hypothetical protein
MVNTSTRSRLEISSTLWYSLLTDTGCVPLPLRLSRSLIWSPSESFLHSYFPTSTPHLCYSPSSAVLHFLLSTFHSTHPLYSPFSMPYNSHGPSLTRRSIVDDLKPDFSAEFTDKAQKPQCTSLAWSADGQTLFAGFSDNLVRVWVVVA